MCFQGFAEAFKSPRIQRHRPEHEMMSTSPTQAHRDAATQPAANNYSNVMTLSLYLYES